MTKFASVWVGAVLCLSGCGDAASLRDVQARLDALTRQNAELLEKVQALEVGLQGQDSPPKRARAGRPDPAIVYNVPIGDAQTKGPAEAKVTIVEWSDFQCPFCNRVNPTLEQIEREYGDDVRFVFKHNPLPMHPRATPAAIAAEAAGRQGKFWAMHDKLFANARDLTDENFVAWAREIGLDLDRFRADLEDPTLVGRVRAQQRQGHQLGARGTPAFFVNGRFLSGAQPFESFRTLIEDAKTRADAELARGTPPSRLYDTLIAHGPDAVES